MGVQGLWKLVAPAGRRIKIETLENKILAIDVSIWLLKMIHGYLALGSEQHRNIHLTGIFRRLVKLLYYGIKPVFVFDGKFPELKRETVRRRQEFRERRKVNLKKVAEKFLSKVLEERLKETVGRLTQPRRPVSLSQNKGEEVHNNFLDQEEEEEKVFPEDTQIYDYEFDYIVDENKELLLADGIDLEEFYLQDTESQYEIIKRVKDKMRDKKIKKYLDIDSLDEHSKLHVKDYVSHIQRKNKIEKTREEALSKRLTEEQEQVIGNAKFKDLMQSNYMKNFFLDPKKEIVHGSLASDKTKGFLYLTQKNDKYDTQVLKVEKKRGSKNEKLKRLSAQLREIAQHAENVPSLFSFDELLCDNPLEAFRHSSANIKDQGSNSKGNLIKMSQDADKKSTEEVNENVDIDAVFGFDEMGIKAESIEAKEEDKEAPKEDVLGQDDQNSNFEDLFEYKIEDQTVKEEEKNEIMNKDAQDSQGNFQDDFQIFSQNSGIDDIKSKIAKLKEEFQEEMLAKERLSQKVDGFIDTHKLFDHVQDTQKSKRSESPPREKKKVLKKDSKTRAFPEQEAETRNALDAFEETYYEPEEDFTRNVQKEEQEDIVLVKRKASPKIETVKEDSPSLFEYDHGNAKDIMETETKKEESTQIGDFKSPSPRKKSDDIEKKKVREENNPPAQNQTSWFKRLMKETDEDLLGTTTFEEKEMEITMTKEPKKETKVNRSTVQEEQKKPDIQMSQNSMDFGPDFGEDFDFMDMDEEKLVAEMKDLEDPDNLDKWALMQEFQKFQNLSEFEAGSMQEKFNEIKELLIMFGVPWVDSPTEAEAQCSFLEQHGLVDGVITDDSDVFLFGGKNVYRNIFEKGDFAHSYKMNYIENDMALDREKLILLALFLGSDYTLGIRGVGIVNAIEIVTAFDNVEALKRFKEWAELPDVLLENASEHYRNVPQKELDYKLYHRNFKKHWELPEDFPDERVINAYLKPSVDESLEKFQWGKPDFPGLEKYCETRLKWDEARIYNLLEPLKRAINDRGNQTKITDFFREDKIAIVNSKRINDAIKNLKNKALDDFDQPATITKSIDNIIESQNPRNIKKRKTGDYANEMIKHYAFDKKKVKKNT